MSPSCFSYGVERYSHIRGMMEVEENGDSEGQNDWMISLENFVPYTLRLQLGSNKNKIHFD